MIQAYRFVLVVMTKPKEKDGVTKYHVNRRVCGLSPSVMTFLNAAQPIPLDLLTLVNFTDPPQQRGKGILGGLRGGQGAHADQSASAGGYNASPEADARAVYPCTIHHNGRLGGVWTVYAETA